MKKNITIFVEKNSNSFGCGCEIYGYTAQQMRTAKKNMLYTALNPAVASQYFSFDFYDDEEDDYALTIEEQIDFAIESYVEMNDIDYDTMKIVMI